MKHFILKMLRQMLNMLTANAFRYSMKMKVSIINVLNLNHYPNVCFNLVIRVIMLSLVLYEQLINVWNFVILLHRLGDYFFLLYVSRVTCLLNQEGRIQISTCLFELLEPKTFHSQICTKSVLKDKTWMHWALAVNIDK